MLSIGRKYIASKLREELAKKTLIYHNFFTKQNVIQSTSDLFNGKNNSNIGQLGVISSSMMSPSSFLKSNMDNCDWYDLYSNMTKNKDTTKYIPEFEKYIGRVNDFWIENTDLWNTGKINFEKQKDFFVKLRRMNNVNKISALLSVIRYDIFLELSEKYTCFYPPLDVDVVWHSHLLSPAKYNRFCLDNFGKLKDHMIHSHGGDTSNDHGKKPVHNYETSNKLFGMTDQEMMRFESMNAWDDHVSQVEDKTIMDLLKYAHNPLFDSTYLTNALDKNKDSLHKFVGNKSKKNDDFDVLDLLMFDEIMNYHRTPKNVELLTGDTGYKIDTHANCTITILDENLSSNHSGCDSSCSIGDSDCSYCD